MAATDVKTRISEKQWRAFNLIDADLADWMSREERRNSFDRANAAIVSAGMASDAQQGLEGTAARVNPKLTGPLELPETWNLRIGS